MKLLGLIMVIMLAAAGCGNNKDKAAGGGMGGFSVPVVGKTIIPEDIQERVLVVGSLAANESIEVKSQIESKITEIHFEEGQQVKKDDVLLVLDREKLQASLAQTTADSDIAKTTFNRMNALVGQGAVSKQEFDKAASEVAGQKANVELISAQLADTIIKAPFDGVIGERMVSLGQVIGRDNVLTVLIDENPMKVDFHVPERYASRVQKDQNVELNVAAYPEDVFKGVIYFVDPQVDEATRTILVKAKVDNPDGKLRRGMFAKIDMIVAEKEQALVVPETALIPKGDDVFIFTIDKESKAQMMPVKVGLRQRGTVEIISGLKAGDTVITEGYQKIGPGSPVTLAGAEPVTPTTPAAAKEAAVPTNEPSEPTEQADHLIEPVVAPESVEMPPPAETDAVVSDVTVPDTAPSDAGTDVATVNSEVASAADNAKESSADDFANAEILNLAPAPAMIETLNSESFQ